MFQHMDFSKIQICSNYSLDVIKKPISKSVRPLPGSQVPKWVQDYIEQNRIRSDPFCSVLFRQNSWPAGGNDFE